MKNIDKDAITLLIKEVENKMGYKLHSPSNFDALILGVQKKTDMTLSISTIKRLWGYVPSKFNPSYNTLSVLSRFIDYRDWDDFCARKHIFISTNSSVITNEEDLISRLENGDELYIEWLPESHCKMLCIENGFYLVEESKNCKLRKGDKFRASFFAVGHPLYAKDVQRELHPMAAYMAGKKGGLTVVKVIKKQK